MVLIRHKKTRGLFFSLDAIIALVIIFVCILVVYPTIKYSTTTSIVKTDILDVMSNLKIKELQDVYVQNLITTKVITNSDKNVLDVIGELYVSPTTKDYSRKIAKIVLDKLNSSENIGIWFDTELVAWRNTSSMSIARNIEVDRQIITGIKEGKNITGFTARAYLAESRIKKYWYFGGYVGEGNITMNINYKGKINSSIIETTSNENFKVYVNGELSADCAKSTSEFIPATCELDIDNFHNGLNEIELKADKRFHVSGGYLRIIYESEESYGESHIKYFTGIDGLINIFDGVYVPDNIQSIDVSIHYNSTENIMMTIGNQTIFTENSSGLIKTKSVSDADIRNMIDYSNIKGKTVPLRIGLLNYTGTPSRGVADIVFVVDSTQSMYNEINDVYNTIGEFSRTLNDSNIDFRLGLVDFKDFNTAPCGMSTDYPFKVHNFSDNLTIDTKAKWKQNIYKDDEIDIPADYIRLQSDSNLDSTRLRFVQDVVTMWSFPPTNNVSSVYGDNIVAQTFRPSYTGTLSNITLRIAKKGDPDPMIIEIHETANGRPNNNILASTEVAGFSNTLANVLINFSSYPTLTAGRNYAVVIKVKGETGDPDNKYLLADYPKYKIPASGEGQNYIPESYPGAPYTRGTWCNKTKDTNGISSWNCPNNPDALNDVTNPNNDLLLYTYMFFDQFYPGYKKYGTILNQYNAPYSFDWYDYRLVNPSIPAGSTLDIKFRSSDDASSWSSWSTIQNVPDGMYLQQNITLTSDGTVTPIIYAVVVRANFGPFTNNITKYLAAVDLAKNSVANGNDGPEGHLMALNVSLNLSWKDAAKKFIVLLSDNMTHAKDCMLNGANTDLSCNKGPKTVKEITNWLVEKKISMFYVNHIDGLCDNRIIADDMTTSTNGKFYSYTDASGVQDIILDIAGKIVKVSFVNQTAIIEGDLSNRLYPDSFIQLKYQAEPIPYGLVLNFERNFSDKYSGNFTVPEKSQVVDAKVLSYSGERWTDYVKLNGKYIYNLSNYGENYVKLGDPYVIVLNNSIIEKHDSVNNVSITTGLSPLSSEEGSEYNKIIYTLVKNLVSFSMITPSYDGCIWELEFDDGTAETMNIPVDYTGSERCYYQFGNSDKKPYYENDALKISVYDLFTQMDVDKNGKIDVKFMKENLDINSSEITGIPYHYTTQVQVRRWY